MTLIEKLEAATGPDRDIDAKIVVALDIRPDWLVDHDGMLYLDGRYIRWCSHNMKKGSGNPCAWPLDELPRYTASIDAAMTLAPEGWRIGRIEEHWRTREFVVQLTERASNKLIEKYDSGEMIGYDDSHSKAATAPIAICIAAIKAKGIEG